MICPCFQMTIYYTASDRSIGMIEVAEAMLLLPPWMSTAGCTLITPMLGSHSIGYVNCKRLRKEKIKNVHIRKI